MSFHFPPHSYEDETPPSLSHSRSDSLSPKSSLSRSSSSSSSVASSSASASVAENNNIRFFVLLLCPSRLYFELVTITVDELALRNESTIYDILRLIPRKCAERRLLNYQYVGFVRTSDQVIFSDLDVRAFRRIVVAEDNQDEIDDPIQHMRQTGFLRDDNWTGGEEQREYIGENDVLVAVLEGYSAHGMIELSEPVLRNPAFADAISRQKSQGGVSFTQASYKGAMSEDNVAPPPHSSPPVRSFQSTEVMGVEPTSSNSLLENTPIRQEYADFLNWNDRCLTLDNNSTSDEAPGVRGASTSRGGGLLSDIVPIFNSKGKFIDHESRGMLYQDNPGLTSPSRRSGSSEDPWSIAAREIAERLEDTAPQRKMRNKRYALIFTLLVSFVFIGSAIFFAGEKRESDLIRLRASSKELGREGPESDTAPGITEGTPRPTEKPTHKKKHDHADRKPTKKPSHKKHNHGDHHPSTSTEKHDHGEHTSSQAEESTAVSSDTSIDDSEVPASATDTRIHIKPRALATVDMSNPDFKLGGLDQLGVDRDERLSFVHFELSSISGEAVSKATLNLYLTAFELEHGALLSHITIAVDALPRAGDWSVGSVSWSESLDTDEPLFVDELVALPLASDSTEQLYEVDVTSAILQAQQWVTFRLSTESRGSLSFASEQWNEGELAPELVVTLAA